MATSKSPFFVVDGFLTPKQCEAIANRLDFLDPDVDSEGNPIEMKKHNDWAEQLIYDKFVSIAPELEEYYDFDYRATERVVFEYRGEGTTSTPSCESSSWIKKQWVRTKDRDLSVVIFLSDYQDNIPFDDEFEVYGGKLEFLQHNFGFNPQRGTMVVYPSGPHFINAFSEIEAGELLIAKFHIAAASPYLYNPANFPGDFSSWFSGLF